MGFDVVAARRILIAPSLALLAATAVRADGLEFAVRHGPDGGDIDGTNITLRLPPQWEKAWGGWRLALQPEFELGHLRYSGDEPAPRTLEQVAAVALLRLRRGNGGFGPYAEIGLGAALLSRTGLGDKHFSTHFQFTEQVGLGAELNGAWFVGWRYSHYSNANLERPNNGLDLHQLLIGVRF